MMSLKKKHGIPFEFMFWVTILCSILLIGSSCCVVILKDGENYGKLKVGYIYHLDQKVDGDGFFRAYESIGASKLSMDNTAHGSGSCNFEYAIDGQNDAKYQRGGEVEDRIEVYDNTWNTYSLIDVNKSMNFLYAPFGMKLGKYSPRMSFKSKGSDGICLDNYASNFSIDTKFNYADQIEDDLTGELAMSWRRIDDVYEILIDEQATSKFNLEAAFSGKGHISVMNNTRGPSFSKFVMDEDYIGTYSLTRKIFHEVRSKERLEMDEWLPCCSGGYSDMIAPEQELFRSAEGIFNCTCSGINYRNNDLLKDRLDFQSPP